MTEYLTIFLSGSLAFIVFNTIRKEYERHPVKQDNIFITTLLTSTYDTIVLSLANAIKPNNDSVHLTYLINCIKNSKDELDAETYDHLTQFIGGFETTLATISPTINRIVEIRDTTIAHLDRNHVNNPSFLLQKPATEWKDVEIAYDVVGSGLIQIGKYLGLGNDIQDYIALGNLASTKQTLLVFNLLYK